MRFFVGPSTGVAAAGLSARTSFTSSSRDLFERVWQDGGTIVAVKPREAFLRYFEAADELARRREKNRGVKSGSDGTRTRDLWRDRPVRRQPVQQAITRNYQLEQVFPPERTGCDRLPPGRACVVHV